MKFNTNKKYNSITLYILLIVAISLLMIVSIFKFGKILLILKKILSVLMPIIWGLAIAFLLNPVVKLFERILNKLFFKKKPHKLASRRISVAFAIILTLTILSSLIYIIVPEMIESIKKIFDTLPASIESIQKYVSNILNDNPKINTFIYNEFETISKYLEKTAEKLQPEFNNFVSKFTIGVLGFLVALKNFILGIIVSIYLLLSKEKLLAQAKKIILALFKKKTCENVSRIYHKTNSMFIRYFSGTIIDSFIVGILCFIGTSMMDMPYAVLISVIVGLTNVIPFFGPFIGLIPSSMLILLGNPSKIIPFLIFILILQQIDGNIIAPGILGNTTGLPAVWVLFAIFLGGGLFGFVGMLLGVPAFAVVYALFRTYIEEKLEQKNLPKETTAYEGNIEQFYTVKRAKDMANEEINFEDYLQPKKDK